MTADPRPANHRIAIDIGGTFTDCVVVDGTTGRMDVVKVPSTPADPSQGFVAALKRAMAENGVAPTDLSLVMHATTVATNAILEGRLARTALVVTRGIWRSSGNRAADPPTAL